MRFSYLYFVSFFLFFTFILPTLGEEKKTSIKELIDQLSSNDFSIREKATVRLRDIGQKTIPHLKTATLDKNLETGYRCLQILKDLFYHNEKTNSKTSNMAKRAIIEISNTMPIFYNDTFNIMRGPCEQWLSDAGGKLVAEDETHKEKTKLLLEGEHIVDKGLQNLQYFPEITHLEFLTTSITDKGLNHLYKLKNLKSLYLNQHPISDTGITVIILFDQLENLHLDDTNITDKSLEVIAELKKLKHLSLNNTRITDTGIAALNHLTELETLELENSAITDKGLMTLLKLPKLSVLNVKNSNIKGLKLSRKVLTTIKKKPNSIKSGARCILKSIYALGHVETNNNILTTLKNISESNPQSNLQVNHLIKDLGHIWLNTVNAEENGIINLTSNKVNDAGLMHLNLLTDITQITIGGQAQVTDEGLKHLKNLKNITQLSINLPNISDKGLSYLTELTNIKNLDLSHTQLSDKGLSQFKNLSQLYRLKLEFTPLTGAGLKEFDFTQQPSKVILDLSNTLANDKSIFVLHNKINWALIDLRHTKVSPEGIAQLKIAFKKKKTKKISILSTRP